MPVESPCPAQSPRLLESMRDAIRRRHYSYWAEQAYVQRVRRFVHLHGKRHPHELREQEVTAFLNHLARVSDVAAATRNQPVPPYRPASVPAR